MSSRDSRRWDQLQLVSVKATLQTKPNETKKKQREIPKNSKGINTIPTEQYTIEYTSIKALQQKSKDTHKTLQVHQELHQLTQRERHCQNKQLLCQGTENKTGHKA